MANQEVPSYGLYWEGPIAWLVQGRGGTNFVGLKKQNPFQAPRFPCNHLIPAAAPIPDKIHWEIFLGMKDQPVLQHLLPVPREIGDRVAFVEATGVSDPILYTTLSRLSSPIRPAVKPAWMLKIKEMPREMTSSNIQPLIITGVTQSHQPIISAISDLSTTHPRPVLLVGDDSTVLRGIPRLPRMDVDMEQLMMLPLENIGATALRRFARREDVFAPMESRDERRSRMISERHGTQNVPGR